MVVGPHSYGKISERSSNCDLVRLLGCVLPSRLAFTFSIHQHFLIVSFGTVREPLDKLDASFYRTIDGWELVLYVMSLAFAFEGLSCMKNFSPLSSQHHHSLSS